MNLTLEQAYDFLDKGGYGISAEFIDHVYALAIIHRGASMERINASFPIESIYIVMEAKCFPHMDIQWIDGEKGCGVDQSVLFTLDIWHFRFRRCLSGTFQVATTEGTFTRPANTNPY